LWKKNWRFPKKLNIELPYGTPISPLGKYPKGIKSVRGKKSVALYLL
jgi:hypothetical protein